MDHQIQKLNDEKVVFLRRLSKRDLEILTQDNMIKHLHCDLCSMTNHIKSLEQQLKELSNAPSEDEHPWKVPNTHSLQQPVIWDLPEDGPIPLPLLPLTSSLTGPSPQKVIPYVEPPSLQPDGYSLQKVNVCKYLPIWRMDCV